MYRLIDSIKESGVREPGLARPRPDGGYELLCGNRRKRACELAHIPTMPVIIRVLDDNCAAIVRSAFGLFSFCSFTSLSPGLPFLPPMPPQRRN
jgi:hypothetical protein